MARCRGVSRAGCDEQPRSQHRRALAFLADCLRFTQLRVGLRGVTALIPRLSRSVTTRPSRHRLLCTRYAGAAAGLVRRRKSSIERMSRISMRSSRRSLELSFPLGSVGAGCPARSASCQSAMYCK